MSSFQIYKLFYLLVLPNESFLDLQKKQIFESDKVGSTTIERHKLTANQLDAN